VTVIGYSHRLTEVELHCHTVVYWFSTTAIKRWTLYYSNLGSMLSVDRLSAGSYAQALLDTKVTQYC